MAIAAVVLPASVLVPAAQRQEIGPTRISSSGGLYLTILIMLCLVLLALSPIADAAEGQSLGEPCTALADIAVTNFALPDGDKQSKNDPSDPQKTAASDADKPPTISSSDAARLARQKAGGRVLNVVLQRADGRPYYLVKILQEGQVRLVHIDARPQER